MIYVGIGLLAVIVAFALLVAYARISGSRAEAKLRDDIRSYVLSKGGTVTFDDADGMTIEGPLGSGHQKLTSLRIMLGSRGGNRETTLGFALRKYLPDRFDELFEQNAARRLDEARGAIAALSPEALRERLRVAIVSSRASATGLATCGRAVVDGLEARVVLDGFELDGLPSDARSRLVEDDAALFDLALSRTLGAPADLDRGEIEGAAWLAAPSRLFGARSVVVAGCGKKLAWVVARPEDASRVLADLASRSLEDGPLKGVLIGWDGSTLARIPMARHTIKGPATPDYTLEIQAALREAFGLAADARGAVGVSRG